MNSEDRLRGITSAYARFKADPKMVLPTPLMLMLEDATRALEDEDSRAADAGIRKDQLERFEGRADMFGQSACGRSDRAGR